jgi:hypothetical protein
MKKLMILGILFFVSTGCASAVRVRVLRPPEDGAVAGVKSVLVVAVTSDSNALDRTVLWEVADGLCRRLRRSAIYKKAKISVHDIQPGEGNASLAGMPEGEDLRRMGASEGADALIIVRVEDYDVKIRVPLPRVTMGYGHWGPHRSSFVGIHSRDTFDAWGRITAMFTMVRTKDLMVLSDRTVAAYFSKSSFNAIAERDVLSALARQAAVKYMGFIDVGEAFAVRRLLMSRISETSNNAVDYAYADRWSEAAALWTEACAVYPYDPAPAFNLGVYHETHGTYEKAQRHYLRARTLTGDKNAFETEINDVSASVQATHFLRNEVPAFEPGKEKDEKPAPKEEPVKPVNPQKEKPLIKQESKVE